MNKNNRVPYIDAWRFFAIALVIVSHVLEFSHSVYGDVLPGLIWRIHPMGPLGVHIFFCISGYVICRGMMKEVATYGSLSMRDFYLRRVLRIVPPFLLYLSFLTIMVQLGIIEMTAPQFMQSASFLCNIKLVGECGWYVGHTWSLAFEEQFYMVFPLIFVGMAIARKRRKLLPVIGALLAAVMLAHLASQPALAYYLSIFGYMLYGRRLSARGTADHLRCRVRCAAASSTGGQAVRKYQAGISGADFLHDLSVAASGDRRLRVHVAARGIRLARHGFAAGPFLVPASRAPVDPPGATVVKPWQYGFHTRPGLIVEIVAIRTQSSGTRIVKYAFSCSRGTILFLVVKTSSLNRRPSAIESVSECH